MQHLRFSKTIFTRQFNYIQVTISNLVNYLLTNKSGATPHKQFRFYTHLVSIHKVGLYHGKAAFNSQSYFDQVINKKLYTNISEKKSACDSYTFK